LDPPDNEWTFDGIMFHDCRRYHPSHYWRWKFVINHRYEDGKEHKNSIYNLWNHFNSARHRQFYNTILSIDSKRSNNGKRQNGEASGRARTKRKTKEHLSTRNIDRRILLTINRVAIFSRFLFEPFIKQIEKYTYQTGLVATFSKL